MKGNVWRIKQEKKENLAFFANPWPIALDFCSFFPPPHCIIQSPSPPMEAGPYGFLRKLAVEHHAPHVISAASADWYGGKTNEDTLDVRTSDLQWLEQKDTQKPWLVVVGDKTDPEGVLCIDKPEESLAKGRPHPSRSARIVRDFRVVWRKYAEVPKDEPSLTLSLPPLPMMTREERLKDYAILLADAELILYAAKRYQNLPPITFLPTALAGWGHNSAWTMPHDDLIDAADPRHLRLEFLIEHMRKAQAVAKRHGKATIRVRAKLREWWAATASIPWKREEMKKTLADPDPELSEDGFCLLPLDQRDLYLHPYRRVRTLQLERATWIIAEDQQYVQTCKLLDELLQHATPVLAETVRNRMDEDSMPTVGWARRNNLTGRALILENSSHIRHQVRNLAELAEYLPPCMALVHAHGQATQHLHNSDRYYASAFLASLGQADLARQATIVPAGIPASFGRAASSDETRRAVDEGCQFFIGRPMEEKDCRDLANDMKRVFYPGPGKERQIWSCAGIRKAKKEGKISPGSVIHCGYTTNGQCLSAAGLAGIATEPLAYPAQFTALAIKKKLATAAGAAGTK